LRRCASELVVGAGVHIKFLKGFKYGSKVTKAWNWREVLQIISKGRALDAITCCGAGNEHLLRIVPNETCEKGISPTDKAVTTFHCGSLRS
jgi:hypothetical protein